jgi:alkyl hydroperoxide reductase subunit AhpC
MNEGSPLQVGQPVPAFEGTTQKGFTLRFPEDVVGKWCVFFTHPANFTASWLMYARLISMKERDFALRNTVLIAFSHEVKHKNDFSDQVRDCVDIFLKGPVLRDTDFAIADYYGMATPRQMEQVCGKVAFIIDPEGIVRYCLENPQPSIETIIRRIELALYHLQGEQGQANGGPGSPSVTPSLVDEGPDFERTEPTTGATPAYFNKKKLAEN